MSQFSQIIKPYLLNMFISAMAQCEYVALKLENTILNYRNVKQSYKDI